MKSASSSSRWRQWFRPNRVIPLFTILGAGTAIVLDLLTVIELSIAEEIIIALLALLAIDALSERLSLLEKIETRLSNLPIGQTLRSYVDIPLVEKQAGSASEICVVAVAALSVLIRNQGFFERKLRAGCKMRVILLDPDSPSLKTWNLLTTSGFAAELDIRSALERLKGLSQRDGAKGACEVRLLNVFLPFSMFAVDLQKESGSMVVEYHSYYKTISSERPHVFLTPQTSPHWFSFYRQQFEQAWCESTAWIP